MAVVVLALAVVASATAVSAGRGRFVPNEIIVKFRAQPTDADNTVPMPSGADHKPRHLRDLRVLQGRFRVREMSPLVSGERPTRRLPQLAENRLSNRHRRLLRQQGRVGESGPTPSFDRIYRIKLDSEAAVSAEEILAAYRSRADVEYAEFNPIISICATPGDPSYSRQWSLSRIHAPEAWDTCRGSSEVVVAIIDTGVDYNHRDLQGNLWMNEAESNGVPGVDDDGNGYVDDIHGYNFAYNNNDPADDHGHGTHVAGIVAAAGNNGLDVAGVCWTACIMPIKILGAEGDGSAADAVPAIYYAVANGADIISGSWGGQDASDALREAIAYAHRQGVIVVAAAGNGDSSTPYYPAGYPEVIAVTATDSGDRRWYLANYGDWVDIAAPGRDIVSLRMGASQPANGDLTSNKSGTSMAAPHVSGACALLLSANPLLTRDELLEILTTTGDPIAAGICSSNGRLNLYKALQAAIPTKGVIRLDREHYGQEAGIGILVADWHLRGVGRQVVLVEAGGGDEELVTLTESEISLGVFQGDILIRKAAAAKSGDGMLQVQDGQSILARYLDDDDGLGHVDQWRQAAALADYTPPTVLNVKTQVRGITATISLQTDEPVRAEIRYGTTAGGPYDRVERESQLGQSPGVNLSRLSPQTTYCFVVAVTDEAGNETLADNAGQSYTFVTSSRLQGLRVPADHATIQAAIDEAADGDTIWIADGTYWGQGNLEIDFQGKAITVRSENGPANCVIDCRGEGRAFYFNSGESAGSVLDGFTITNGDHQYGAGIYCVGSSPTIRNCILSENTATHYGGGLCNSYGSHPTVVDCTFRENSCSTLTLFGQGGAIANRHGSSPIVSNCTFIGNSAWHSAGALGNFEASSPRVTRCAFRENSTSLYGGAVGNWQDCRPSFRECVFSGNRAEFNSHIVAMSRGDGGAVANMDSSASLFENCIFSHNVASALGGAMNNHACEVTVANCTFSDNRAQRSCGGIWSEAASEAHLDNCIVWGNTDDHSDQQVEPAQIVAESSDVQIRYCDVQGWSGVLGGIGNFGLDPLFVDPADDDYHLQSGAGRWDSRQKQWVCDAVTSPCIDAGNPGSPLGNEPRTAPDDPNDTAVVNKRIDMGAYGGTAEASIAPAGWSLMADANNDSRVDWMDFALMVASWARAGERCETDLTRDGRVNGMDLAHLASEWRHTMGSSAAQSVP